MIKPGCGLMMLGLNTKTNTGIISDKSKKELLLKKSKKFIEEHCYKIDGKASERVVEAINKEIKNDK